MHDYYIAGFNITSDQDQLSEHVKCHSDIMRLFPKVADRSNQYDGQQEYWIVTRESGKRTEESSMEKKHTKEEKASLNYIPETSITTA